MPLLTDRRPLQGLPWQTGYPAGACANESCMSPSSLRRCQQWLRRVLGFRDSIAEKPLPQTGVKDAVSAPAERLLATVKAEAGGRLLPLSHGLVEDSEDCGVGWDSKVLSPMADIFRTLHPNRCVPSQAPSCAPCSDCCSKQLHDALRWRNVSGRGVPHHALACGDEICFG